MNMKKTIQALAAAAVVACVATPAQAGMEDYTCGQFLTDVANSDSSQEGMLSMFWGIGYFAGRLGLESIPDDKAQGIVQAVSAICAEAPEEQYAVVIEAIVQKAAE